jgi:hypothetical protein
METKRVPKCPNCGSDSIVPIHYGYPMPKMRRDYEAGKIDWGGCVITGDDPRWLCKACENRFGRWPRRVHSRV